MSKRKNHASAFKAKVADADTQTVTDDTRPFIADRYDAIGMMFADYLRTKRFSVADSFYDFEGQNFADALRMRAHGNRKQTAEDA